MEDVRLPAVNALNRPSITEVYLQLNPYTDSKAVFTLHNTDYRGLIVSCPSLRATQRAQGCPVQMVL